MRTILKKYFIILISVFILTQIIPSISISGKWQGLFYSSFVLCILLYIAQPIINLIMLPLNLLTLNMTSWILNILIIFIWTLIVPQVKISDWQFNGGKIGPLSFSSFYFVYWQVVILAGISITLIIQFVKWLVK
ncbi:phage holin family protein [Candidatus Gottesmanbacteria bacterium]|nr:phage holin family protein [Candidatus Gottesmanbacteria bacterium]